MCLGMVWGVKIACGLFWKMSVDVTAMSTMRNISLSQKSFQIWRHVQKANLIEEHISDINRSQYIDVWRSEYLGGKGASTKNIGPANTAGVLSFFYIVITSYKVCCYFRNIRPAIMSLHHRRVVSMSTIWAYFVEFVFLITTIGIQWKIL